MRIKPRMIFGSLVLLVSMISVFATQVICKRYLDSKLSPENIIEAVYEEGFTTHNLSTVEHCNGPLKCGDSSITFELCDVNACIWGDMVLYSSTQEARYSASTVNGMNCLLGKRALWRGRLVLGIPCDNALAERVKHVFQNAKQSGENVGVTSQFKSIDLFEVGVPK